MEDRAQVLRRGTVELLPGTTEVVVAGVAPVLVDKTVTARVTGGVSVAEVRVDRRWVRGSEPMEPLDAAVRGCDAEVRRLEASRGLASRQLERLREAYRRAIAEVSQDAAWGAEDAEGWHERLASIGAAIAEVGSELPAFDSKLARARQALEDARATRAVAESPTSRCEATVVVRLVATEPGEATLELDYLVPCACWRPWHRARLQADGRLVLESEGCVWQYTGEDWTRVQLHFSTERASLGATPPGLRDDRLRTRKVGSAVVVESRTEAVDRATSGKREERAEALPGIDDGGEPLRVPAASLATVPSNGRPVRVPMFLASGEARADRLLAAELMPAVMVRTKQANAAARPLLPGPVDLVRSGGLSGRTWVDFVAPGEPFELGWGPDQALRVHREVSKTRLEARVLSSWRGVQHDVEVRVSNIGAEARRVEVCERVPVSEIQTHVRVQMDREETTGGVEPDRDGFLRWPLEVAAFSTASVSLRYVVRRHSDVVG